MIKETFLKENKNFKNVRRGRKHKTKHINLKKIIGEAEHLLITYLGSRNSGKKSNGTPNPPSFISPETTLLSNSWWGCEPRAEGSNCVHPGLSVGHSVCLGRMLTQWMNQCL